MSKLVYLAAVMIGVVLLMDLAVAGKKQDLLQPQRQPAGFAAGQEPIKFPQFTLISVKPFIPGAGNNGKDNDGEANTKGSAGQGGNLFPAMFPIKIPGLGNNGNDKAGETNTKESAGQGGNLFPAIFPIKIRGLGNNGNDNDGKANT